MNPSEILARTLNVNPVTARYVYGGLGILAAAAIVIAWGSDLQDLGLGALYVMIFAFAVAILAGIASNGIMSTVVSWILIAAFGAWVLGLVGSVFRVPPSLPPTPCYLRIVFELPSVCEDRLRNTANDLRIGENGPARPAAGLPVTGKARLWYVQDGDTEIESSTHSGQVFIQFAEPVPRTTAADLASELAGLDWQVAGADGSGPEMVEDGPKTNEVRYFKKGDRDAAIALAETIHALHPEQPVFVRDFTRLGAYVRRGTLEIWLTQPMSEDREG